MSPGLPISSVCHQELTGKVARNLKSFAIIAVAIALAYWFARRIDWVSVGGHLRHANYSLLILGSLFINATLVLRVARWLWFLRPITRASAWDALASTVIGFGCMFLVGRAGDLVRPVMLSLRSGIKASATIATILIERLFDMTAVALLFAGCLLVVEVPPDSGVDLSKLRFLGLLMVAGIVVGLVALIVLRLKAAFVVSLTERLFGWLPKPVLNFLLGFLTHVADGLSVLMNLRALAATAGYTALIWGVIAGAYWLVVRAFGVEFSISQTLFVLGAGLVGSLIPTPGGSAGAFHVAAQKGLTVMGVELNLAASIAIAIHFISFGSPFLWALFYLTRTDFTLKQLKEMVESGSEEPDKLPNTLVKES